MKQEDELMKKIGAAQNNMNARGCRSSLSSLRSPLPADIQVVTVTEASLIPQGVTHTSHPGGLPVAGDIYIDSSTITIHSTGIQLDQFKELTPEEKERLKNLEEDRKRETKKAKLDIFKKLPSSVRQQVVDHLIWSDAVNKITSTEVPKSKEQQELEIRDELHNNVHIGFSRSAGSTMDYDVIKEQIYGGRFLRGPILPKDITPEELIRAHAEATAEEALLGTDTESK
jgi:hypothetical protein